MPSIDGPRKLQVTSGVSHEFDLTGNDPDAGDTFTFHVVDHLQGLVTLDAHSGHVTYTPDFDTPIALR